ncbi:hypothetical protein [Fredinandcohnia onubensis]|uniref:hypothetical protein n=1 Tax=Fredinandcohnia onubensis TaxID=1571209 RepID=UPI000C0BD25B|nr:hypothetical protein [Fredinandcohnia onubensis]
MLQAILKGKVPSELVNSEDLLTSSVIGTMRYITNLQILKSILEQAINASNEQLSIDIEIQEVIYYFWPKLENSEPDVLIQLKDSNNQSYIVCIEAKYFSGKSSYEDETVAFDERKNYHRDQLAREIEDLYRLSTLKLLNIKKENINAIQIIYLTNDTYIPIDDIENSSNSIREEKFKKEDIYWLCWKRISNVLRMNWVGTPQDKLLLIDLINLFKRTNLISFGGFEQFYAVEETNWQYTTNMRQLNWRGLNFVENNYWTYRSGTNG